MAITILQRKVLGNTNFITKTIKIYSPERSLEMDSDELKRLTNLGECCIKVAQTLVNKKTRKLIEEMKLRNYGNKEYPTYNTDMHWFFGVIGGLEIYATQLCDGPRYFIVYDCEDMVFEYNCEDAREDYVKKPLITKYIKGPWELKVLKQYKIARMILNKKVLTLDNSGF